MKKNDVIKNKSCGIKWYEHVENEFGVDTIIAQAIEIYKKYPTVWGVGWSTVHWAFGNAFRSLYDTMKVKIRNNGQSSFNLDEVLTTEQINYIAKEINLELPFKVCWERD